MVYINPIFKKITVIDYYFYSVPQIYSKVGI